MSDRKCAVQSVLADALQTVGCLHEVHCAALDGLINNIRPKLVTLCQCTGLDIMAFEHCSDGGRMVDIPHPVLKLVGSHLGVVVDSIYNVLANGPEATLLDGDAQSTGMQLLRAQLHIGLLKMALLTPTEQVDPATQRALQLSDAKVQVS